MLTLKQIRDNKAFTLERLAVKGLMPPQRWIASNNWMMLVKQSKPN